ncbi:tRNA (adenosine(37)-N6)-threonylcarbamoyltransferase complex dimerization subunit type 1 TsaB [uncultured Thiodictyon sp.]|uniref:tRNA (adenosine(37)-N6)-threonylcarbamoyltransferase complex dimerization subunit type 1 TsaB n=1 Tax=uncultured Thiodictyon sp. TaxID=1846217 RepID=UPI0025F5C16F|nr:tRNA (adenosine(37)-N6)-threonylcarbamoyltransferase complex dimerization subunit type 1 TsaB [uncultured Thiodictyon sp.]
MKLLALDTSGDACSAALYLDGAIEQRLELAPRGHAQLILPMMQSLLASAGIALGALDAIAFGRGPGSFTGVRIAVAVAQGVAFGAGRPTVPVSTLAALAQGALRRSGRRRVLAALDARMGEVYWGAYEVDADAVMRCVGAESVAPPGAVQIPPGDGWYGVGPGWAAHRETLAQRIGSRLQGVCAPALCEARDLAPIAAAELAAGRAVAAELARPVYLRERVTYPAARVGTPI